MLKNGGIASLIRHQSIFSRRINEKIMISINLEYINLEYELLVHPEKKKEKNRLFSITVTVQSITN